MRDTHAMRRPKILALALLAGLAVANAALAAGGLSIDIDQSKRISLAGHAANVVVGNPAIADVAMIDARNLLVLGRGYGSTSVTVLDSAGHTLWNADVTVTAPTTGRVSLYRGAAAAQYACSARCEPAAGVPATPAAPAAPAAP